MVELEGKRHICDLEWTDLRSFLVKDIMKIAGRGEYLDKCSIMSMLTLKCLWSFCQEAIVNIL